MALLAILKVQFASVQAPRLFPVSPKARLCNVLPAVSLVRGVQAHWLLPITPFCTL